MKTENTKKTEYRVVWLETEQHHSNFERRDEACEFARYLMGYKDIVKAMVVQIDTTDDSKDMSLITKMIKEVE